MRPSVAESIAAAHSDRWPAQSIVVCTSCGRPIYTLGKGLGAGEKASRAAGHFYPISLAQVKRLQDRRDINAGWRARWKADGDERWRDWTQQITVPKTGDPCLCPICHEVFLQARAIGADECIDRAYVLELVTIPPEVM